MDKLCGIYKITSPSDRIYIGQSINIKRRFKDYLRLCNCKLQLKLYRSFKKYGTHNHIFEIIEICDTVFLNERERFYQDHYNVLSRNGLNCRLTKSNDKSGQLSAETIKRLSDSCIASRKLGIGNPPPKPMIGEDNPMYGKKHSEETIYKMKKNRRKITGENHCNSSVYLNVLNGCFYFSLIEAADSIGLGLNYFRDRFYKKIKNNKLNIIKV